MSNYLTTPVILEVNQASLDIVDETIYFLYTIITIIDPLPLPYKHNAQNICMQ
jgi:hypothetical protein